MFSLMGNCVSCIKKRREPKRPITLAILGLDCAGKTTAARGLTGEPHDEDLSPTVGFNSEKFTLGKFDITMFDLGGGKTIRNVWPSYLAEVYGIVYMIDSTATDRMDEVKTNFQQLVQNGKCAGKPILVLANKQDKEGAMEEVDICEHLQLEHTVNIYKCPCRVESCSAIRGTGRKMDPSIKEGMQWLCDMIEKHFYVLSKRVQEDMAEADAQKKIEAAARRERVRKMKEERERLEEEENRRLGIEKKTEEEEEEDCVDAGDPFKRVNVEKIAQQEAKEKEDKKRRKELRKQMAVESSPTDGLQESEYLKTPRSNRPYGLSPLKLDGDKAEDSDDINGSSRSSRRVLPPLQQPLGTKFLEEAPKKKNKKKVKQKNAYSENEVNRVDSPHYEDDVHSSDRQKTMRSVSKISVTTKSFGEQNGYVEDLLPLTSDRLASLDDGENMTPKEKKKKRVLGDVDNYDRESVRSNGSLVTHSNRAFQLHDASELTPVDSLRLMTRPLPPLHRDLEMPALDDVSPAEKKVKKKKKTKRNQLSPSIATSEVNDLTPSAKGGYSSHSYPWDTPDRHMDVSDHDDRNKTTDFSTKWGLVDDLPQLAESTVRNGPNYDDDDDI